MNTNADKADPGVEIMLGGKKRTLKFTHRAFVKIEKALNGVTLYEVLAQTPPSFTNLSAVLWGGLVADDKTLTLEQVIDMLDGGERSFQDLMEQVVAPAYLQIALTVGLIKKNPDGSIGPQEEKNEQKKPEGSIG